MQTSAPATTALFDYQVPHASSLTQLRLWLLRLVGRQTWIPKGRDFLARKILHPDHGHDLAFEAGFFGMRYPGNLSQYIDWMVFTYGSSCSSELTLLADLATELRRNKREITFFDIGGNVGHHSLFMAPRADRVVVFEPFPWLQEKIREKIALNRVANVQVVPVALGEVNTTLTYYPGGGSNSGTGTFVPEEDGLYKDPVELMVRNGDELCDELRLPPIDLIKIDVEGLEPSALRGLARHIQRSRPPILMELSDRSRAGYGSEENFRSSFYDRALFAEVTGLPGRVYQLKPLRFQSASELLVLPPEMSDFLSRRMQQSAASMRIGESAG